MGSKYRDLQAAQPGWYVYYQTEEEPFYYKEPVVCWAITDRSRYADDMNEGVVALVMNEELWTLAEPIYDPDFMIGIYHDGQVTPELAGKLREQGIRCVAMERGMSMKDAREWLALETDEEREAFYRERKLGEHKQTP